MKIKWLRNGNDPAKGSEAGVAGSGQLLILLCLCCRHTLVHQEELHSMIHECYVMLVRTQPVLDVSLGGLLTVSIKNFIDNEPYISNYRVIWFFYFFFKFEKEKLQRKNHASMQARKRSNWKGEEHTKGRLFSHWFDFVLSLIEKWRIFINKYNLQVNWVASFVLVGLGL